MSAHSTRFKEYISRLETEYALPAQTFVKEMFDERPLLTVCPPLSCHLGIFAASSFTPVVFSVAIAIFTVFLAISTSFLVLLGLALLLAVTLTTTLVSSAALTLLGAGVMRLRSRRFRFNLHRNTPTSTEDPLPSATSSEAPEERPSAPRRARLSRHNRRASWLRGGRFAFKPKFSWKSLLGAFILFQFASRIIPLPRVVRYSLIYRAARRHGGLALVFLPMKLLWRMPFLSALVLVALSPRFRRAARRMGARVYHRLEESELVRNVPWKAYAAATLEITQEMLLAVINLLRAQLQALEPNAKAAAPAATESHEQTPPTTESTTEGTAVAEEQDAYEMVSMQVGGETQAASLAGGTTSTCVAGQDVSGIRARNGRVDEED
ncbi:hypothetical protein FB45DRAFT_922540 [Roridomyces roridus]|uniref:Transmembrane protein n=1 Tax=Roridomyces roridus TaxID=1738132 RepID=A0AAD7BNA5_9AGAR|nr:hypothetical protein FB45DRAFT_922540 [Roridomyces roridus]